MSMPLRKDSYTYRDYLNGPEGARVELIGGRIYAMTPAPTRMHQSVIGNLFARIYEYLRDKTCEVYVAPFDVRLPGDSCAADDQIDTVVQPDISVICDPAKLDDRGCRGAPDLIVEVTSPGSLKLDLTTKKSLYEQAGVREYWIVYPGEKAVLIHYLNEDGRYGTIESFTSEDAVKVAVFDDLTINLSEIFK